MPSGRAASSTLITREFAVPLVIAYTEANRIVSTSPAQRQRL